MHCCYFFEPFFLRFGFVSSGSCSFGSVGAFLLLLLGREVAVVSSLLMLVVAIEVSSFILAVSSLILVVSSFIPAVSSLVSIVSSFVLSASSLVLVVSSLILVVAVASSLLLVAIASS